MYLGQKVQVTPNAISKASPSKTTVFQGKGLPNTDLRIICKGQTFYAHKSVVGAASEHMNNVFKREQYTSSSGGDDLYNMILATVEPVDVSNILKYIYEDELTIQESEVDGFVSIAKILQVDKMLQYMPRKQTPETAQFQPLAPNEVNPETSFDSRTGNPILARIMDSIPFKSAPKKGKRNKGKPIALASNGLKKNEPVAQSSKTYANTLMSNVMRSPDLQQEAWPDLGTPSTQANCEVKCKELSRKAKRAAKKKANEAQTAMLLNQLKLSEDLRPGVQNLRVEDAVVSLPTYSFGSSLDVVHAKQRNHSGGLGAADGYLSRSQGSLSDVRRKIRGMHAADMSAKEHLDALMSLPPGVTTVPNVPKKKRSKSFCTEDSSFEEGVSGSCGDIHKRDKPDLVTEIGVFKKNVHSRSTRKACLLPRRSECDDSNDQEAFASDVDYDSS